MNQENDENKIKKGSGGNLGFYIITFFFVAALIGVIVSQMFQN